jgi:hypothetical protein
MPVIASIKITQNAVTNGPGVSLIGVGGLLVTLENGNDAAVVSWKWDLLDTPLDSAIPAQVLSDGPIPTASFTPDSAPDTPGCYRIKLTILGSDGSTSCDIRNFAVPTTQGWILPPFRATSPELNFPGNAEGWESLLNRIFLDLSAGGALEVKNEGVSLGAFPIMNFVGVGVHAQVSGTPNQVDVYVPPPAYLSHWNTSDGTNGNQSVTESISRTVARISTPNGGEGFPFKTGGWANTDQPATLSPTGTFTTPGDTTGFGGDSTMTIVVYDADGVTPLDSYTTPAITGNAVHTSPSTFIVVTITNYGADGIRFKANASVGVNWDAILSALALTGGRIHATATHTTDSVTDGTGPYVYTQPAVFEDTDPTTPSISGVTTLTETGGFILTKHLSGLEYYILASQFDVSITGIDQLNRNTARATVNLIVDGTEYGLPTQNHSPFGVGAANFAGWTSNDNQDAVSYTLLSWAITAASYRFIGTTANVAGTPQDSWAAGATVPSANASILVDTYVANSTALFEDFDDEVWRENATFTAPWLSTASLIAGELMVFNSFVMMPSQATFTNWTTFKPDLGGANPDYTPLVPATAKYFRRWNETPPRINMPSFQMVFTGTFAAGNMLADLVAGNVEIFIYKQAGLGNVGKPPGNSSPIWVHDVYNFPTFDDGTTQTPAGAGCREGTSSGNTINCTFGGFSCDTGTYMELRIVNSATQIDSITVTFF